MKDILIIKQGKNAQVVPQTENAKKVFKKMKCATGFTVTEAESHKILGWAISHNLSVDSQLPIVVKPLLSPYEPKFSTDMSTDWQLAIENSKKNFEHLEAIDKFAKQKKQLLYRYFHVGVADGRVYYQVTKVTKTKATVTLCYGIDLDNYVDQILGEESVLPIEKATQLIESRDAMDKLFSK